MCYPPLAIGVRAPFFSSAAQTRIPHTMRPNGKVIYVGGLPGDIRERDIEDLFHKARGS